MGMSVSTVRRNRHQGIKAIRHATNATMLQVFISFIMSSSYASSDNMSGGNSKIQDVGIIHENHDHSNKVYQEMFNVGMDISKEVKAIIGGCACFWGGVFILGVVYIAVVYIKRNF